MKAAFFGATKFSESILINLIENEGIEIVAIFSIPKIFSISYSEDPVENTSYADLSKYALDLKIPFLLINSEEGKKITDHLDLIESFDLDVLLVMGWYYMVPKKVRSLAKYGAWGIHASLLPKYAGGAPLVWAMINGESRSGVTLFRLGSGVDDGDVIGQEEFEIDKSDTIKEVYEKATKSSISLLIRATSQPISEINYVPQERELIEIWPQRSPEDGKIDWTWDVQRIRNFIRAQSKPYPGAWTIIEGKKIIIWQADIEEL